jgi:ribonuclease HI
LITIYTDGSARGNPGPGGFGAVLISGKHRKEISQGYRLTTNNRMELLSVISALEALKKDGQQVTIYSDSQYVVYAVEKGWLFGWEKTNFKKKKNADLWQRFLKVFRRHKVKFVWVRGHADNALNNYCDRLAVSAAEGFNLINDEGYSPDVNGDS